VIAHGFVSSLLQQINELEIVDELRVIIRDEKGATAYFTFSSQMKPQLHLLRLYGPKNGLEVDQDHDELIKLRGQKYKSYADKFIPPLQFAKQHIGNWMTNVGLFLSRDFQGDAGIKYLTESFYNSIRNNTPVPIPYREILLTARIMDAIFEQLNAANVQRNSPVRTASLL
jgi:hypothetical protein